jgi:hypothetical protein
VTTAFVSPPAQASPALLREARLLSLLLVPDSPEGEALVTTAEAVIAPVLTPNRKTARRAAGAAKMRRAVGAIIGGVLSRWASGVPRAAFRSRAAGAFTGAPVARRQFCPAADALVAAGLLRHAPGVAYAGQDFDGGDAWQRLAGRYWPAPALLAMAEANGLHADNVRGAWRREFPTEPPTIETPVELRVLVPRRGGQPVTPRRLPIDPTAGDAIRAEVDAHNAMAAAWTVGGCIPPRWRRVFIGGLTLHGRWYGAVTEPYQTMSKRERAGILLNGEPVSELDLGASHLSILSVLAGSPLDLAQDPYAIPGVDRAVAKRWVVATLGNGGPITRAPRGGAETFQGLDMRAIKAAILARHPVLEAPASVVPAELADRHGGAKFVLPHYLAGIEAEAMTMAMRELREGGILSLPVHDSLIVPRSAEAQARAALVAAFEGLAGFTPRLA